MRTEKLKGILLSTIMITALTTTLLVFTNTVGAPPEGKPDHVVISELFYDSSGADENCFTELYNPTRYAINIGGWQLKGWNGSNDTLYRTITIPGGAIIQAHGFYLVGQNDPLFGVSPDYVDSGADWQNGPDAVILEDATGSYVDGVGYGYTPPPGPSGWADGDPTVDVSSGNSLQRKSLQPSYAPCQDTDNNAADFEVLTTPTPMNSSIFMYPDEYFLKECMPDLGQHCVNWCWAAAAANSIYWWSQHGYPELIDDPENVVFPDNNYITQMIPHPPPPVAPPCFIYRLLHEIAIDCLYPGWPDSEITIENTWCQPMVDANYFFGLQEFIKEQGASLIVHEIVDNNLVWMPPPQMDNIVIYRPPTLEDYQRELERCQDVLLWLNFMHYENGEDTDHVVTGVGFSYDNTWILVSDPWTPGAPDHGNDLHHAPDNEPYENLLVLDDDPLVVQYEGRPVQVSKLVYISPLEPECGVEVTIEPEHKRGTPCTWLTFVVEVHNTGNIVDNYLLWVEPDGWPMENIILEDKLLLDVLPCETRTTFLYVHIPENAVPCTHKEIVVVAESEFCGATDNDNALIQVVSKYLHVVDPDIVLPPDNWVCTYWHEIYPDNYNYYHLSSWEDNIDNPDYVISPCDQIDLTNVENENDITWYHVKDVTCTLCVEWEPDMPPDTWWYLEYENGWDNYCWAITHPECTQWNEVWPKFCNRYHLAVWDDYNESGKLDYCDGVLLVDKVTGDEYYMHVANVATDLVLCEKPPECGVEVTIEPEHKRGTPCTWLTFVVEVHNTGINIVDNYLLSVVPDGWPMENIILEDELLLNVRPCETRTTFLYVHIPENAVPCTHKEIVVVAESEFCGATDNDNALIQVVSKYLHNTLPGEYPLEPGNWLGTEWHEIYPTYCQYYLLSSWEDNNMDGMVSPGDQIDLMDENENITWYYIKDVTCTLVLEIEEYSDPDTYWYLEFEDGWDNYCSAWWDPLYTQWNEIRPVFCNRYLLVEWIDSDLDGYLSYCDWVYLVDKATWEPLPFPLHVVEIVTDLVLCEKIVVEPYTGSAVFSLVNLYTLNVEKILDLNDGSKLVVKFYTYGDAYENENVIETFVPPAHVEENENARHPGGTGVKKARLVLVDGAGAEIAEIATFTVRRSHLMARIAEIDLRWPYASFAERSVLMAEIADIDLQWPYAPP